jgi:hypothetical protein
VDVAAMDARLNRAVGRAFSEAVEFAEGGASRATYFDPREAADLGLARIDGTTPVIALPLTELQRLGAREGTTVVVRGATYTLMAGVDEPVTDAGGMAFLPIRQYA